MISSARSRIAFREPWSTFQIPTCSLKLDRHRVSSRWVGWKYSIVTMLVWESGLSVLGNSIGLILQSGSLNKLQVVIMLSISWDQTLPTSIKPPDIAPEYCRLKELPANLTSIFLSPKSPGFCLSCSKVKTLMYCPSVFDRRNPK